MNLLLMTSPIGQIVKKLREFKGLTQQELASLAGKSVGFISKLEAGAPKYTNPTKETVEDLAKALGIDPLLLHYYDSFSKDLSIEDFVSMDPLQALEKSSDKSNIRMLQKFSDEVLTNPLGWLQQIPASKIKGRLVPVLGHAACGNWEDWNDLDYIAGIADKYSFADTKDENAFFVVARGDSMVGGDIKPGDLLLVEPNAPVFNGCKVLAKDPDNGCTVKLFFKENGRIRLQPMNPKYSPIYIDSGGEDFRVYKISGKFSKL